MLLKLFPTLTQHPANAARLRGLILQLAVQGKLTAQWRATNPEVESTAVLLEKIAEEKARLVKEKKIKKEKSLPEITEEEKPFALPEGWAWCRLRDLVSILGDGIHGTPQYDDMGNVFFINGNNLNDGLINIKPNTKKVSEEEAQKHFKPLNERTVLVSINGTIGNTAFYNGERIMLGKSACYFNLLTDIDKEYIRNVLKTNYFLEHAFKAATGTTIKNVSLRTMRAFCIPLPPFAEQKAIVAVVEQLLAEVDQLEAQTQARQRLQADYLTSALRDLTSAGSVQRTPQPGAPAESSLAQLLPMVSDAEGVKQLRAAILQLAVQGQLTANWRANRKSGATTEAHASAGLEVESAAVLLEKIAEEKAHMVKEKKIKKEKPLPAITEEEKPFALPEGWAWCRLDDILAVVGGVTKGKKATHDMVTALYLRVANVQRGYLDLEVMKEIVVSKTDFEKYQLLAEDLLIVEGGDYDKVGRCAIWGNEIKDCIYQNHVFRVRPYQKEGLSAMFMMQYINSPDMRRYFESCSKQTTNLASINKTQLRSAPLAIPPLEEQKAIVEKVDSLMALCDQLEAALAAGEQQLTQLMESCVREVVAATPHG